MFKMKLAFIFVLSDIVLAADLNFLRATIEDHFSENRHHEVNPANKQKVQDFIQDQFEAYGLETELQSFKYLSTNTTFTNVIGIRKGSNYNTREDRVIGLGAHYDTVKTSSGVDDNGSGMAAMLHAMKNFNSTGSSWKNTMVFVAFDAEELLLEGSRGFVQYWWTQFIENSTSKNHSGFIILDTIMDYNTSAASQIVIPGLEQFFPGIVSSIQSDGGRGDFITAIYRGVDDVGDNVLADSFKSSWQTGQHTNFEIESLAIPTASNELLHDIFSEVLRSDHWSFWQYGFTAIFLTDTANYRGNMENCYHNPCDNLTIMLNDDNVRFLGKTADAIIASMDSLALREERSINVSPRMTCSLLTLMLTMLTMLPILSNSFRQLMM